MRWECNKHIFKFKWYLFKVNHIMRQVVLGGMHNNSNRYDKNLFAKGKKRMFVPLILLKMNKNAHCMFGTI